MANAGMAPYFFWLPVLLYLIGWLLEFGRYWRGSPPRAWRGGGMMAVGWGAHTFLLASQLWGAGFTISALLDGVAWVSMVVYYGVHLRFRDAPFGFIFVPFSVALLLITILTAGATAPLPANLGRGGSAHTPMLIVHVVTVLAGHLLFALACLASIVYLYEEGRLKAKTVRSGRWRIPPLATLERMNHKAIALGFFFLSVGILLGVLVRGMDQGLGERALSPRQLVPVLTWVVYAVFLLEYTLQGKRGRFGAIWSIAGFVFIVGSILLEMSYLLA